MNKAKREEIIRRADSKPATAEAALHEQLDTGTQIGACRFCGQIRVFQRQDGDDSPEDLDEAATELCNCEESESYRRRKKIRTYARRRIDALFTTEEESSIASMVSLAVGEMAKDENDVNKITITDNNGVKATVSISQTGKMKITRESKIKRTEEIN